MYVCDKSLCENKVCFSHPTAVCRVNPCGGCNIEFVDDFNSPVNCDTGLSECQKELQKVLNSPVFSQPLITGQELSIFHLLFWGEGLLLVYREQVFDSSFCPFLYFDTKIC